MSVPKFLRIPAYARQFVPGEVDSVPVLPIELPTDESGIFAVRLRDNYTNIAAVILGERGYVLNAMSHAIAGFVATCAGRDPILVLWGIKPIRKSDFAHIAFHSPQGDTLTLALPEENPVTLYAVQARSPEELRNISALPGATVYKFKNYVCVAVSHQPTKDTCSEAQLLAAAPSRLIMPLTALLSAPNRDRMVTLHALKSTTSETLPDIIPEELKKHIVGLHMSSKAHLRVLFKSTDACEALKTSVSSLAILGATFGLNNFIRPRTATTQGPRTQEEKKSLFLKKAEGEIVVRRIDGAPILPSVAQALAQALGLKAARCEEGMVIGSTDQAAVLHEKTINNVFIVGCRAWV